MGLAAGSAVPVNGAAIRLPRRENKPGCSPGAGEAGGFASRAAGNGPAGICWPVVFVWVSGVPSPTNGAMKRLPRRFIRPGPGSAGAVGVAVAGSGAGSPGVLGCCWENGAAIQPPIFAKSPGFVSPEGVGAGDGAVDDSAPPVKGAANRLPSRRIRLGFSVPSSGAGVAGIDVSRAIGRGSGAVGLASGTALTGGC